jgi:hypothetical protein
MMSTPRLKYSKRLAAAGAVSAAAALTLSSASAAVAVVGPELSLEPFVGFISFTPTGASWVDSYDTSYTGMIRNCGLNLLSNNSNFQWTTGAIGHGTVVDDLQAYNASSSFFLAYPADGETVYVGYRLMNQGSGANETYYGFVQVTGSAGQNFEIDFYSYENSPNTGITVVPEPSTTLLWVAGAGLAFTRRRRRA